jgi:hypothetical protein
MSKAAWCCPHCQTTLHKGRKEDGEGVKRCPNCKASWFLLLCRSPQPPDTFGQLELPFKEAI